MRLLVVNGNMTQAITDGCAGAAREVASIGTEIVSVTGTFGPQVIASRSENAIAHHGVMALAARHAPGCDAVVVAVSLDTAVPALRELLPIPVVGITEAGALTACTVGAKFALVTFGRRHAPIYGALIDSYGLGSRCVGVEAIDAGPEVAFSDPRRTVELLAGVATKAIVERGAEAILMAGAISAGWQHALQALLPVPVVEGVRCATLMAESLVRMKMPKPTVGSYAAPGVRTVHGLDPALTALLSPAV